MFKHLLLPVAMALSLFTLGSTPSQALPGMGITKRAFLPQATRMAERGRISAPYGHVEFCMRNPAQCRSNAQNARTARLSRGSWRMLQQVNFKVNANIRPQSDKSYRGKVDHWSASGNVGDCEDYALTKRKELIKRGWAPGSVLIATVRDRRNRPHAVLVAHTNRGDFVLDNQTGRIKAWNKTGYKWLKRQSRSNPKKWVSLSGTKGTAIPRAARTLAKPGARIPRSQKARTAYLLAKLKKMRARKQASKRQWHAKKTLKRWTSRRAKKRALKRAWRKRHLTRTARLLKKARKARRYKSRRSYRKARRSHQKAYRSARQRWTQRAFNGALYKSI
jgi:predicted transglutaminase-like cysteine proteinase